MECFLKILEFLECRVLLGFVEIYSMWGLGGGGGRFLSY